MLSGFQSYGIEAMSASIGFPDHGREASCRALEEARSLALSLGQGGRPGSRRREVVTRRPTRDPDVPAEVAVEVWLREVVPQTGD